MTREEIDQAMGELSAIIDPVLSTDDWREVVKLRKRVTKLDNRFNSRRYTFSAYSLLPERVKSWGKKRYWKKRRQVPEEERLEWQRQYEEINQRSPIYTLSRKIILPEGIQDMADRHTVKRLKESIPEFNERLRAYREKHRFTPVPYYQLEDVTKGSRSEAVLWYNQDASTTASVPVYEMEKTKPYSREQILIRDITHDPESHNPLCGFCNSHITDDMIGNREDGHFRYNQASFFGMGNAVWVCPEDDCRKFGTIDYLRGNLMLSQLRSTLDDVIKRAMVTRPDEGELTEPQVEFRYQKMVGPMIEQFGLKCGLSPDDAKKFARDF
ncbi:MAG: hypothetical protein V1740_06165 [Candidatus Woesearchaeota archaeon]